MSSQMRQEQRDMMALAASFAAGPLAAAAAALDHDCVYPKDLVTQMRAHGLFGVLLPERRGGSDLGFATHVEIVRALSRACPAVASILNHHALAAAVIAQWGDESQKTRLVAVLASGERIASFALAEAGPAVGIGADALIATRDGGGFTLTGRKTFVRNAGVADVLVVFASVSPAAGGTALAAFVLDGASAGMRWGPIVETMGLHGCPVADLIFTGAAVGAAALLHDEAAGAAIATRLSALATVAEAGQTVGIAQAAAAHAARFARQRVQFHHPIAHQEAIQTLLAEMATDSQLGWLGVQHAAALIDAAAPFEVAAAMVQSFLGRFGARMLIDGCQIEGGLGISESAPKGVRENLPLARMFRDIAGTTLRDAPGDFPEGVIAANLV